MLDNKNFATLYISYSTCSTEYVNKHISCLTYERVPTKGHKYVWSCVLGGYILDNWLIGHNLNTGSFYNLFWLDLTWLWDNSFKKMIQRWVKTFNEFVVLFIFQIAQMARIAELILSQ